jgi:Spy/CpxP family protein refolding chaperone
MTGSLRKRTAAFFAGAVAAGALTAGMSFAPNAGAADGCGIGFHLENGNCVVNIPGPGARFVSPNCWINDNGDERCYAP